MLTMTTIESPLGTVRLFGDLDALVGVYLPAQRAPEAVARRTPVLDRAAEQLAAYFAGELHAFDVPLAPRGTPFQRAVWDQLVRIPLGTTRSYGELAHALGRPSASRAVGTANGRNPLSIIVPCHRVVGASGALTGYAGGLAAKQWLLEHERRLVVTTARDRAAGAGRS